MGPKQGGGCFPIFEEVPSGAGSLTPPHSANGMVVYSRDHIYSPLVQRQYKNICLLHNTVDLHLNAGLGTLSPRFLTLPTSLTN